MGYTTEFAGSVNISPALSAERTEYINRFSDTRRMKRNVNTLVSLYGGKYGLESLVPLIGDGTPTVNGALTYGFEGEFFARDDGNCGQSNDASIIDFNTQPSTQPSLWCQWVISPKGDTLEWDGGEKFYNYVEWLKYVIKNFIEPTGSVCNGQFEWRGEDWSDMGVIIVKDNKVTAKQAKGIVID
jgi:hypothetical protein